MKILIAYTLFLFKKCTCTISARAHMDDKLLSFEIRINATENKRTNNHMCEVKCEVEIVRFCIARVYQILTLATVQRKNENISFSVQTKLQD